MATEQKPPEEPTKNIPNSQKETTLDDVSAKNTKEEGAMSNDSMQSGDSEATLGDSLQGNEEIIEEANSLAEELTKNENTSALAVEQRNQTEHHRKPIFYSQFDSDAISLTEESAGMTTDRLSDVRVQQGLDKKMTTDRLSDVKIQQELDNSTDTTLHPSLSLNAITSDDILNTSEIGSPLTITGTTSGVEDGQTVTPQLGTQTYTATAVNQSFEVTVPAADLMALAQGPLTLTAHTSDTVGNPASDDRNIFVEL